MVGFPQKSTMRKSRKKNVFIYSFWCLTWILNRGLTSNKPTYYLPDYGDFKCWNVVTRSFKFLLRVSVYSLVYFVYFLSFTNTMSKRGYVLYCQSLWKILSISPLKTRDILSGLNYRIIDIFSTNSWRAGTILSGLHSHSRVINISSKNLSQS